MEIVVVRREDVEAVEHGTVAAIRGRLGHGADK
jgi:hypothetical protein